MRRQRVEPAIYVKVTEEAGDGTNAGYLDYLRPWHLFALNPPAWCFRILQDLPGIGDGP
jgi:hypothetical protein